MSHFVVMEQPKNHSGVIQDLLPFSTKECFLIDLFNYEYSRPALIISQHQEILQRLQHIAKAFKNLSSLTFSCENISNWEGRIIRYDYSTSSW